MWTRQRRTTVGMGSLRHRRIKERTILEEGEINDCRDRMGACRSPMRSYPVLPTQRLLRTWTRFLSPISFYTIVLGDNAPSDIEALLFSGICLWTSLSLPYTSCSRRLHQKLLKGGTAPDLWRNAVHLRPFSYSRLHLNHIFEIAIYHVPSSWSLSNHQTSVDSLRLPGSQSMVCMTGDYLVRISRPFAHP